MDKWGQLISEWREIVKYIFMLISKIIKVKLCGRKLIFFFSMHAFMCLGTQYWWERNDMDMIKDYARGVADRYLGGKQAQSVRI